MLLTEKEASERWCPFARVNSSSSVEDGSAINRGSWTSSGDVNCIGSRCMAWRWQHRGTPICVPEGAEMPVGSGLVKRGKITISSSGGVFVYDEYVTGFRDAGDHAPNIRGCCGFAGPHGAP